ncbi:MAG: hypothetical protein AB1420_11670 [Bacillota bacterium]
MENNEKSTNDRLIAIEGKLDAIQQQIRQLEDKGKSFAIVDYAKK